MQAASSSQQGGGFGLTVGKIVCDHFDGGVDEGIVHGAVRPVEHGRGPCCHGDPYVMRVGVAQHLRCYRPVNEMGLTYFFYWIPDVFWLGPPAPKVLAAKHISNPDVAPFWEKLFYTFASKWD